MRAPVVAAAIVTSAVVGAFLACVAAIGLVGVVTADSAAAYSPMPTAELVNHPSTAIVRHLGGCNIPAPTTSAGYAKMFSQLPASQWGAADVSISVPIDGGRILWLYGDTLSQGRFVHSSAIVQDKGCLHVMNGGQQLLPNADAHHIYWISSAVREDPTNEPDRVTITARAITLTGKGPWDFKDGGFNQLMSLWVGHDGNAAWTIPPQYGWNLVSPLGPSDPSPAPSPGPMYSYGPHHFGYARHVHPEITLADGHHLVTTCQNWDDGTLHPFADYRPLFTG